MSFPHKNPRDLFGADLIKVFGPKATRRHISSLSFQEKKEILAKIPVYVPTDDLGPRPSIWQVANKMLTVLQQSGALVGIDLNWCTDLSSSGLVRDPSMYIPVEQIYKNNSVQRGIFLRHLCEDILFEFDPSHVLMGLARKLSDDTYNFNNGQHRTTGCVIIGVTHIPAEYIESDLESVDVDEYATDNLNTLAPSEFDDFRIRVKRNQVRKAENRADLIPKDCDRELMYDIHNRNGSRFIEKGSETVGAKECTGVGNMIKYFDMYTPEIYERAVSICCSVFSKAPFATANAWAIMEFIREQDNNGPALDAAEVDFTIMQSILYQYTDPKKNGMHLDIKKAFKSFVEDNPGYFEGEVPEQRYLAAGIYKLCKHVYPEVDWAEIKYNKKDLSSVLKTFKQMPIKRAKIELA
jgi:hypothetical protein